MPDSDGCPSFKGRDWIFGKHRFANLDLLVRNFKKGATYESTLEHKHPGCLVSAQGLALAQTTNESPKKPIAQMSCKDYLGMDDVVKPKFIYYTVGYSHHGKPTSATFDVVNVDKIVPVVDEYCRVHLTASAYQKVMDASKASEKTNK